MTLRTKEWAADARQSKKRGVPLHERAYRVANHLVGIMEHGGNNTGTEVMALIRANGGSAPEPWCGDTVAYCYRVAGCDQVSRRWAAVVLLNGGRRVSRKRVVRGDIVKYDFPGGSTADHTGVFVKWRPDRGAGYFEAIEGNTGATGAVSDSSTGGDGVYRKVRHVSQVHGFRHYKH